MNRRNVSVDDAPNLAALDARCFPAHTAFPLAEFSRLLSSPEVMGQVVESARGIVAFVLLGLGVGYGEIVTLDVAPEYRRKGYGRGLLRWAHAALMEREITVSEIHVKWDNHAAISLYEAEGYRLVGRVAGYYPGGEAALRMACALLDSAAR